MKIYRSLPEKVIKNGIEYNLNAELSAKKQKPVGKKYITVNVLPKSLENKTDLYGNKYKPSAFIFVESGKFVFDREKINEVLTYLRNNPSKIEDFDCWIEQIREKNKVQNDYI